MSRLDTDVLILGAGSAALVTALAARRRRVCILAPAEGGSERSSIKRSGALSGESSKERSGPEHGPEDRPGDRPGDRILGEDTASDRAQGGLAAAVGPDDTPALHLEDTLSAGCRLNHLGAARLVCREAPAAVAYLAALGVPFERTLRGWALHKEAAHSRPRVLHAGGDATGAAIMRVLRRHAREASHIEMLCGARAVALLRDAQGVCGAMALAQDGRALSVRAREVVIATGGVGGLYSRSTNPLGACGDGPAMALAAGARCAALEFVQFHPTALDIGVRPLPLMTEALRGAGARLIDEHGVRLMQGVHPLGDLAPRDVVARAVYAARAVGRRVWLDARSLRDAEIATAFPAAYGTCRAHGIDPRREPIPVTPAAHYHMGGVAVNLEGRASLPGLWAAGEAACTGLHGANRLASNSLLEAVVFGRRVGRALDAAERRHLPSSGQPAIGPERESCKQSAAEPGIEPRSVPGDLAASSLDRELRELMWDCMGVVRSDMQLTRGLGSLARLRERIPPQALLQRARLLLAEHMMRAAARRRTSCGAHYRSDDALRLSA